MRRVRRRRAGAEATPRSPPDTGDAGATAASIARAQASAQPRPLEPHDEVEPALEITPRPWQWSHPRVLVEHRDEAEGLAITQALRLAGYAVSLCAGPQHAGECPLHGPDGCIAAQDADAVVCCLGYEHGVARGVLRDLRARCTGVPLLVESPPEVDAELRALLADCDTLATPATPQQVVAAVGDLLGAASEGARDRA